MKNKHQAKEFHLLFANNTKGNGFACTNTNEKWSREMHPSLRFSFFSNCVGNWPRSTSIEMRKKQQQQQQQNATRNNKLKQNMVDASVFRLNKTISEQFLISKQIFNYRKPNKDIEF